MLALPCIYIVDDDEAVRDSLAVLLDAKGYTVRTFPEAAAFLDTAASLRPGCVIADVRMPGMDGLELQQQLIERALRFPLIVITGHGDVPLAVRAMKAGAVDFIQKPFASEVILASIAAASARIAEKTEPSQFAVTAAAKVSLLTPREREVLQGLVDGLPNRSVAYDPAISPRTVEIHRARIMEKMGARSFSELVRISLAAGVQPSTK
jgi:two-component system response regulator FixJ